MHSRISAQENLDIISKTDALQSSSFETAWERFKTKFPYFHNFCGELSTVFPGIVTAESDFSILQLEIDPSRSNLSNRSLK